jgi:tripartite-type tricarboxylate transporter receptor subunit TctC
MASTGCLLRVVLACLATISAVAAARADEFFAGKSITFNIGTAVGGGYDTYSRLIARHIGLNLPGKPNVVPQNMPGGNGMRGANYLYAAAPKDGTAIGMIDQAIYLNQILGAPELKADARRFNWLGRIVSNSAVLFSWHTAPVKTINDVFKTELIVATSGAASKLNWTVLNNVLGTKFKLITGYQGTSDSKLAMIRGEVHALSMPWPLLRAEGADMLANKEINLLLQTGADRNPELAAVPRMIDLATNDDDRTLISLFSSPSTIGRAVVAPPDVPPERVAMLRAAFMAAMASPALIEDAKRLNLDLEPMSGEAMQEAVAGQGDLPDALVARARIVGAVDK